MGPVRAARGGIAAAALAIATACSGGPPGEPTAHQAAPILGGSLVDAAGDPVLLLRGPQGYCTAPLIAPNLVVTARHCVANVTLGAFGCTPAGDPEPNTTGAGSLGADYNPSLLSLFIPERVSAGMDTSAPDAVGSQIFDTQTPTSCRDDIAFVVLNQAVQGRSPLPIRLTNTTEAGEVVSVTGYGLTENAGDPLALRTRGDMQIVGVGPDMPLNETQAAPLRAVRVGPSAATCSGDSGGPIAAASTGAVIAVVSLGFESVSSGPFCADQQTSATTGPRLAEYSAIAMMAFQAAQQTPILEPVGAEPELVPDAAVLADDAASDASAVLLEAQGGGSCSVGNASRGRRSSTALSLVVVLVAAAARRRSGRRRHTKLRPTPQLVVAASTTPRSPTARAL